MLALNTHARVTCARERAILKVLTFEEAQRTHIDPANCIIWLDDEVSPSDDINADQWAGIVTPDENIEPANPNHIVIAGIKTPSVIAPGDVVRVTNGSSLVSVLFRRGSNSNTLLATERCNSHCLMCSQPPRENDDHWLVDEMLTTIPLIDPEEGELGISGGEPTLLGDDLVAVIHQARRYLPETGLHILSNGRKFADEVFARLVCAVPHSRVEWGVPVYSDCHETHDYIVQSKGAWDETMTGLYNLARHKASIEIRVVVQQANAKRLGELAYFIFRNLTFVKHVAFMGLEPMGYARRNRNQLWIDPAHSAEELCKAVHFLANRGMNVSVYNTPLCALPRELWPFCRQSISDWKNIYLPECDHCDVRNQCSGFFRTVGKDWISESFGPVKSGSEAPPNEAIEIREASA